MCTCVVEGIRRMCVNLLLFNLFDVYNHIPIDSNFSSTVARSLVDICRP